MRPVGTIVLGMLLVAGCATGGGTPRPAVTSVTKPAATAPEPASPADLSPFHGSYLSDRGELFVIARLGWLLDLGDSSLRTIYRGSGPGRFTIGPAFMEPLPKAADLVLSAGVLTLKTPVRTVVAHRAGNRETTLTVPAGGADLAVDITEPSGPGPHPGIVVVHGSERGERYFYDPWVGLYTSLGFTVATYDKRGVGASTGHYPGEFPTDLSLATYADDASAVLGHLAAWPDVNPKRVGFEGGSQGGWTVPLAILRHGQAAFALLLSAPATTVDQTDAWKEFTGGGATAPTESPAAMDAAVRAIHSGYDPAPALAALAVPSLWILGSNDRTVPTAIGAQILAALKKPDLTVRMEHCGHSLLDNPTGLTADDTRSPGFPPDLLPAISAWLRSLPAS